MVVGLKQRHVAIVARVPTFGCRRCCSENHLPLSQHLVIINRHYSSRSQPKQYTSAQTRTINLPGECYSDDSQYPDLSLDRRAIPRNFKDAIDLSKTRPAILQSPPSLDPKDYPSTNGKPPLSDRAKHLFKIGKSYLTFYKTGFSNVWSGYKEAKAIRQKIAPHSLDTVAKYGGQNRSGGQLPTISRAEYQFSIRSRHDILKLIPFSLVFAICGEFTPLVIIALGTVVVPYTCRIPKQESKDLQKKLEKDRRYMKSMAETALITEAEQTTTKEHKLPAWRQEWLEAYRYNLTSFSQPLPLVGSLWHKFIIQPRLVKHCETLLCSTILVRREGGFQNLDARSIFEWADKYALFALTEYISNKQQQQQKSITSASIAELCSEDLKRALVSACDREASYILNQEWTRLDLKCHWRTTFRSVANEEDCSPDTLLRRQFLTKLKTELSQPSKSDPSQKLNQNENQIKR